MIACDKTVKKLYLYILTDVVYQIFVELETGKSITLEVNTLDNIKIVKAKIYGKEGIPLHKQKELRVSGMLLKDERTLGDYNIVEDSTLNLSTKSWEGT